LIDGGAGFDTVTYFSAKATEAQVTYDAATDTFTVVKHFSNGDNGVDKLTGIERINFTDGGKSILRSAYVGDFRTVGDPVSVTFPAGTGVTQFKAGDFNGDGHVDFTYVTQAGTGTAPAPTMFYLGDGKGGFTDGTTALLGQVPMRIVGGGRSIVADFNGDGHSDLFQLDFGDDAPPFSGGMNSLYLSAAGGKLVDASATLARRNDLNHGGSAGDVDGDGDIDVLVNALDEGNVLLINDGTGHFTERAGALPRPTNDAGAPETSTFSGMVDVNGDGSLDIILGSWDGNPVNGPNKILLNDGHGNFTKRAPIGLPDSGIARPVVLEVEAIDLNGDTFPDLMLSITNGGEHDVFYHTEYIQLLVNDGTGHFRDETAQRLPQSKDSSEPGWYMALSAIDFNNDGFADILAESANWPITSKVYLNRGDGTFALDWESAVDGRAIAADIDEDGMRDLLTADGPNLVNVWSNKLANGHVYKANFGGDQLLGSGGADTFYARDGVDVFDGAGGFDTAVFAGQRARYTVTTADGGFKVVGAGTTATLAHIERAVFGDSAVAFDLAGNAGQAFRIYQAAFGRAPDATGLGFWIAAMDKGSTLLDVAAQFAASAEFTGRYGALDDAGFLTTIYRNVLHRDPDEGGYKFWGDYLGHGGARAQLLAQFSESAENQAQLVGVTANGIDFVPYH
ncbi:MAG TPA: FG-GAP-like repeat-containing protein, partial [Telluria sp.]|nr:FG-GAP-like repeat-containing protein [Telluria sp.]